MLTSIDVKNLTVFSEAHLECSPELNVIVGENDTGKSHLLKAAYSILAVSAEGGRGPNAIPPTKTQLQRRIAEKLMAVLRPETLGRLARRRQGRERCEIAVEFDKKEQNVSFGFATSSKSEVIIDRFPGRWIDADNYPVFLPTRELLTIYPGFVALYDNHYLEFDETWRDTCLLLGLPLVRGPRESHIDELLSPLEQIMGGTVELDRNGRFYLRIPGEGRMEIPLVAEGSRKLAMIARLIATGVLLDRGYLFWDEPDTNLNPKLIREVAVGILRLCRNGIQVFIATHSLFLLRELQLRLQSEEFAGIRTRFFGFHRGPQGVHVHQGDSVDDIGEITSLSEELSQTDRYLDTEVD
jgi:AAA15 family ATPase/GTPase